MGLGQGLGQFVNCFMPKTDDLCSICSTRRKVNSNNDKTVALLTILVLKQEVERGTSLRFTGYLC